LSRPVRVAALVAGLVAVAALLTGCSKPVPKITVLATKTVYTVSPLKYCGFDRSHCRTGSAHFPVVTAGVDDKILIDVPAQVVHKGWAINAVTLDGTKSLGTTAAITNSHSYPFPSDENSGNPYIVQVQELHSGKPDGSVWSFVVQVSATKQ
jgi:hypothetical protein